MNNQFINKKKLPFRSKVLQRFEIKKYSSFKKKTLNNLINSSEAEVLAYLEGLSAQIGVLNFGQDEVEHPNSTKYTQRNSVPQEMNIEEKMVFSYNIYSSIKLYKLDKIQDVSVWGVNKNESILKFDFLLEDFTINRVIEVITSSNLIFFNITLLKGFNITKSCRSTFKEQAMKQFIAESTETEILKHLDFLQTKIGFYNIPHDYTCHGPNLSYYTVRSFPVQESGSLRTLVTCYQLHLLVNRYRLEGFYLMEIGGLLHDGSNTVDLNTYLENFKLSDLVNFLTEGDGMRTFNISLKLPNGQPTRKMPANESTLEVWLTRHVNDVLDQTIKLCTEKEEKFKVRTKVPQTLKMQTFPPLKKKSFKDLLNSSEAEVLVYLEALSTRGSSVYSKQDEAEHPNSTKYTQRNSVPQDLSFEGKLLFSYQMYSLIKQYRLDKLQHVSIWGVTKYESILKFDFLLEDFTIIRVIELITSSNLISFNITLLRGFKSTKYYRPTFEKQAVRQFIAELSETEMLEHLKFLSSKTSFYNIPYEYQRHGPNESYYTVRNFPIQGLNPLRNLVICYHLHLLVERYMLEGFDLVEIGGLLEDGRNTISCSAKDLKNFNINTLVRFLGIDGGMRTFNITLKIPKLQPIREVHANDSTLEAWLTTHVNDVINQS